MIYMLKCTGADCPSRGREIPPGKFTMKYDKKLKKVVPTMVHESERVCPVCGRLMEFVEVENLIPEFSVSTFKGLPDDKKKEILRKRFDKDMKRGSADEKEQRKRNAIEKLIGYGK